ncbi:MAG: non-homologous end-joining DNA ligase [Chloroflexota bacterium]|nr:non-homologous end-joining DNA ligase [Chloroflexota bacterium]
MTDSIKVGGHDIKITHGDRVVFPDDGVTKAEIVAHYARVASVMVPHLKGRPVSMQRVRETIYTQVFYQKDAPDYFPDWIARVEVPKVGGTVTHAVINDAASLVYLANQGCITPHVWLSRVPDLQRPDRMIIDLDPGDGGVADARLAAHLAREVVEAAGLVPHLMATGSRGYHVVVPLRPQADFEEVRAVAFGLAEVMARRVPDRLTTEFYKEKRDGRLFLDCNRNAWAQTAVAPYSIRPKKGAHVAVPLDWSELDSVAPDEFDVHSIVGRLEAVPNPWKSFGPHMRSATAAKKWLARQV